MTPPDPRNYNNGGLRLHFFTEPHSQGTAVYLSTLTGRRCLGVGRGVDLVAQVIAENCGFTTAELVALLGPATRAHIATLAAQARIHSWGGLWRPGRLTARRGRGRQGGEDE